MNPRIQMQLLKMNMQLDTACFRRGITLDADYPKDPDPKNWRTIQGAHVHLSKGKIDGGAGGKFGGNDWTGKEMHVSDPRAQHKDLFSGSWSVSPSKSETESKKLKADLKNEIDEFKYLKKHKKMGEGEQLDREDKIYSLMRQLDPKSKEYKDAKRALGLTKKDIDEIMEKPYKEKADREAANKKAYEEKSALAEISQRVENSGSKNIEKMKQGLEASRTSTGAEKEEAQRKFIQDVYAKATPQELEQFYKENPPATLPTKKHNQMMQKSDAKYEKMLLDAGFTEKKVQELREAMSSILLNASLGMRIKSADIESISKSWFKNQFEVGSSNGSYVPKERAAEAGRLFGCPRKVSAIDGFEREKYGYAMPEDIADEIKDSGAPEHYGDTIIKFKKERLKNRVTYTMTDSLGAAQFGGIVAAKLGEKTLAGMGLGFNCFPAEAKELLKRWKKNGKKMQPQEAKRILNGAYVELQYHGALSMADVESIIIPSDKLTEYAEIVKKLVKQGIQVNTISQGKILPITY